MAELKPGWRRVKFGDVVRLNKETCKDPAAEGLERYVGLEHLEPGDLRVRSWGNIADGTTFTNRFRPGHVLFGKRRAYQRKVAVVSFDGVCSGDIYVLESKDRHVLLPELLPFLCQTDAFFDHAVGTSAGSLSPRTNWGSLAAYQFALPPLDEQERLVRVLSASAATEERIAELVQANEVLLQSATDEHMRRIQDQAVPISMLVENLVLCRPQDGNHGGRHPKACDYVEDGVPFLMASDIRRGVVDLRDCKRISRELAGSLRADFRATNGDILLTHKGTLGESAVLDGLAEPYAMLTPQVTYYRVKDTSRLVPRFLLFALRSSDFRRQLEAHGRQSTRAFVSIAAQAKLEVPWPSPGHQDRVASDLQAISQSLDLAMTRQRAMKQISKALLELALAGAT